MKPSAAAPTAAVKSRQLTMESLALPQELYWDGKTEPISPPTSQELFSISSESIGHWLYDNNNFANEFNDDSMELKPLELEMELSQELLNGEDLVVELYDLKEEHWIDTKLPSPPHLLDYPPIGAVIYHPNALTKVQTPFTDAFGDGVLDNNTNILTELTPPHSPSHSCVGNVSPASSASSAYQQSIVSNSPCESPVRFPNVLQLNLNPTINTPTTPTPNAQQNFSLFDCYGTSGGPHSVAPFLPTESNDDIALKTQIIDAIVENAAKGLPDWSAEECCDESQYSFGYTSPSHADDLCSNSCSAASSVSDDEWMPDCNTSLSSSASASPARFPDVGAKATSAAISSEASSATSALTKKRTRPYGRGVEDRKIRKKEQNKNAATRYRQKKKIEMETVLSEEQILTQRNEVLKLALADREREAKYLRTLIREFYKKKK